MIETGIIRKRVRKLIDASRHEARGRRERAAAAEQHGGALLGQVVPPLCKTVAAALSAEGFPFRVSTPAGAVRLSSEGSEENFIELALDTRRDPPALVGRVSRAWGRRVLVEEQVVGEGDGLAALDGEAVLAFLLSVLGPFVAR